MNAMHIDVTTMLVSAVLGGVGHIILKLRKIDRIVWEHALMWRDFSARKQLDIRKEMANEKA